MDMENTIIFGSDEEWFGRLAINPRLSQVEAFDFFRYEMPNLSCGRDYERKVDK